VQQAGTRAASTLTATPAASAGGTAAGQAILNAVRNEVGVAGLQRLPAHRPVPPRHRPLRRRALVRLLRLLGRPPGGRPPSATPGRASAASDDVYAWAQRTGKAIPAGGGTPQPGDLIVWDEHIGVV
jgi:hypothetical protein